MKRKSHLPFRLNIIFFIIFMLFSILVVQLGIVQILTGEEAQRVINQTDETLVMHPVPRGKMYDRNGNLLVDNISKYAITYTPPRNIQPEKKLEIAETLAQYIEKTPEKITERDKKDYWILKNMEEAFGRLSQEEREKMNDKEEYAAVLERITEEDIVFTDAELEVIAIKRELDSAIEFTPYIVKNEGVTEEEYAVVAEHISEMPGINVTIDWDRELKHGTTFSHFIGGLTDHNEGILRDNVDFYTTRQYSPNDRVGKSFLEAQYETILKGKKEVYRYVTDNQENVLRTELVEEGEQGKNLILTIDVELQKKVDQIVKEELENIITNYPQLNKYVEDALVVMMKPKTGEILAMSGMHYDRDKSEIRDESYRTVYDAHLPGSAVKGATVLAGFESGVINKNTKFYDEPIKIAETPTKSSWTNMGWVNYLEALRDSSNVFMFYIAMKMGGDHQYTPNAKLQFNPDAFRQMRNYFKQFGLGVETGIDIPYEATGVKGTQLNGGLLMDFAIGQYETFTTLQLAQYISTIANDGYRMRPHLVKEIRYPDENGNIGPVYETIGPELLNRIDMNMDYIESVQHGLRLVATSGTASDYSNLDYNPAVKTGTAQHWIYENGQRVAETENHTLVGYAPYENPEIAFSIIIPKVGLKAHDNINKKIGRRIMDAYFNVAEDSQGEPD